MWWSSLWGPGQNGKGSCFFKWVYYLTPGNALIILTSFRKGGGRKALLLPVKQRSCDRALDLFAPCSNARGPWTHRGQLLWSACPLQAARSHTTLTALRSGVSSVTRILLRVTWMRVMWGESEGLLFSSWCNGHSSYSRSSATCLLTGIAK